MRAKAECDATQEDPGAADERVSATDRPAFSYQGRETMITCTRRNGTSFALNPDLIERIEATPDTVITLVSGTKYVVAETVEELVEEVRQYRAAVLIAATAPGPGVTRPVRLHSVSNPEN